MVIKRVNSRVGWRAIVVVRSMVVKPVVVLVKINVGERRLAGKPNGR